MSARYVTGPAYAVVRGSAVVILPERVSPELVDELWRTLGERAGVVPLLEVLTGSFGASLTSLPPFALAVVTRAADGEAPGRVQVAVRGDTCVTVGLASGERVQVTGEGVTTWAERTFDDVAQVAVQVGTVAPDGALVDDRALPLDGGVVLASSVGSWVSAPTELPDPAPAGADAVAEPEPVSAVPFRTEPAARPMAEFPSEPVPEPGAELDAGPSAEAAVAFEATMAPESTIAPELTMAPSPAAVVGAGDVPEVTPVEETSGYGHLWGSTVHRGVEAAAVRPPEEDEEEDEGAGAPAGADAPVAPPTAEPGGALNAGELDHADDRPRHDPPAGLAPTGFPPTEFPPTEFPPTGVPQTELDDDVDGSTVMSSAIADLRAVASPAPPFGAVPGGAGAVPAVTGPAFAPAPVPGRPTILARTCTSGHQNPPHRDDCSVCGQRLMGEARQVPRPSLGVMVVSSGPRITLDRPVVVGRRPRSPRSAGDDLPRLVTVPSPEHDISRSHVEIRLEGWHVLVSDMSTTNGTTLLRSGQPPVRLHPGEPVLVVSSDVLDIGDGVTLTFEGIP